MSIDRALQWTTAAVAVVGALFLALGHESGWLPAMLAIAAALSVLVTDRVPWLRLHRIVGNLIAVTAVAWSLYDFLDRNPDQQLMAISQMLVFLQVLLLFQEKTGRTYWQLLVLSLLQVVVAAALNTGLEFGMLLAAYVVLCLLALVLLCLYRDLNGDPPTLRTSAPAPATAWKMLLAEPQVARSASRPLDLRSSFRPWLLVRQTLALTLATAGFTFVFFYLTPRLNDSSWQAQRKGGPSVSGFSQHIDVEEFGRIHLSNQVVMRAILTNPRDRSPYTMVGEPYFQGSVLTHYTRNENGSRWNFSSDLTALTLTRLPDRQNSPAPSVRQEYVLELLNTDTVFAIFPVRQLPGDSRKLQYKRAAGRIIRTDVGAMQPSREFRYGCLTTALRNGRQLHGIPHANPAISFYDVAYLEKDLQDLRSFDESSFPGLAKAAQDIVRDAHLNDGDALAKALILERHFVSPGAYQYSLNLDFQRNQKLDPIEDFVINHRTGHCEYFASALALMLRSQGIPARVVVGYKGGEYNMLGQYFVIRQKHAHAWVEAWMPPGAVPDSEIAGTPHQGGTWYRLDPTPTSTEFWTGTEGNGLQGQIADAFDYFELLWRDYVVNLNALRQQEAVTNPNAANTFGSLPAWIDPQPAERWLARFSRRWGLPVLGRPRVQNRIFDWRLAAMIAIGLALMIGAANLALVVIRRWIVVLGWRWGAQQRFQHAPWFYRRLERLLARMRLRRAGGQTPRELAAAAGVRLIAASGQPEVAALPAEIVQAYYRVRFGGATLDNSETVAIEHALATLVPAVSLVPPASPAQKR